MNFAAQLHEQPFASPFIDATGHLAAELRRLDLLIARRIQAFRLETAELESKVSAAPAYVSDQEIDWLLQRPHDYAGNNEILERLDAAIRQQEDYISTGITACARSGVRLPLLQLERLFDLSWLEYQVILLCLAPELRRKYDRIYAYLQDDITRKRPSLDLALDLFIDDEVERWQARSLLGDSSNLFEHQLVHVIEDTHSPSGSSALSSLLKMDARILQFIFGDDQPDKRIAALVQQLGVAQQTVWVDEQQLDQLQNIVSNTLNAKSNTGALILHFCGADDGGRRDLVIALCQTLSTAPLLVDGRALLAVDGNIEQLLTLLARESLLTGTPLLIEHVDGWLRDEAAIHSRLLMLVAALHRYCILTFSTAGKPWTGAEASSLTVMNIPVSAPDGKRRNHMWQQALNGLHFNVVQEEIERLTQQFQLSSQQITSVAKQLRIQSDSGNNVLPLAALAAACRDVSHHGLSELSVNVKACYCWADLVLPSELKEQLKNICAQVRFRRQVFDDWGFAQKLPYGRGLSAMFSGTPGTGKTMAAQVIARDLQLELFKIDLSGVVSKYIGETEKNLNRVFAEAQSSNAILFFDEADALFGKRTDVSDAHDRYANIEVSYLLQKMEEYDGIVIMATNFRNNIDDAFIRRIRFILEFPFPDADSRCEIWRRGIPAATPVNVDLDFPWLAERIKVAGGNIKNIILNAAFAAAQQQQPLGMSHLLDSCKLEFQKIGKLWDAGGMHHKPVTRC
jgi:hypothetical protein